MRQREKAKGDFSFSFNSKPQRAKPKRSLSGGWREIESRVWDVLWLRSLPDIQVGNVSLAVGAPGLGFQVRDVRTWGEMVKGGDQSTSCLCVDSEDCQVTARVKSQVKPHGASA